MLLCTHVYVKNELITCIMKKYPPIIFRITEHYSWSNLPVSTFDMTTGHGLYYASIRVIAFHSYKYVNDLYHLLFVCAGIILQEMMTAGKGFREGEHPSHCWQRFSSEISNKICYLIYI